MNYRIPAVALVVSMCLSMPSSTGGQATTTTPPTTAEDKAKATGKNIGTIVSSAFDTAFPIVGKIMDLFKSKPAPQPPLADKKNKQPTAPAPEKTATESEVKDAVNSAVAAAKKAFKEQIQPAARLSKELGVIQTFAAGGSKASQNIIAIKRMLADSKPDYSKIQTEWKKLNQQMAGILTVKPADIRLVQEFSIQSQLLALQAARNDLMVDISDNIDRAIAGKSDFSKAEFESQISAMAALLNGFDSLAAAEIGVLQSDIDNLSIWANSPAGPANFNTKPPDSELLQVAASAVKDSQAALHKR